MLQLRTARSIHLLTSLVGRISGLLVACRPTSPSPPASFHFRNFRACIQARAAVLSKLTQYINREGGIPLLGHPACKVPPKTSLPPAYLGRDSRRIVECILPA